MTVEMMMKINEEFKAKGLLLSEDDLMDRLRLRDDMITEAQNLKAKCVEERFIIDKEKAEKILELKTVTDEKGKGLTEKIIDGNIRIEFMEKEIALATKKTVYELLTEKADSIIEYINIIKMHKKAQY